MTIVHSHSVPFALFSSVYICYIIHNRNHLFLIFELKAYQNYYGGLLMTNGQIARLEAVNEEGFYPCGLLWHAEKRAKLDDEIAKAKIRFERRIGVKPTHCSLGLDILPNTEEIHGLIIEPDDNLSDCDYIMIKGAIE